MKTGTLSIIVVILIGFMIYLISLDSRLNTENMNNAYNKGYKQGQVESLKNKPVLLGITSESFYEVNVNFILPTSGLIEVGDTLFFITRNDTMLTCGNTIYKNLYMRRFITTKH